VGVGERGAAKNVTEREDFTQKTAEQLGRANDAMMAGDPEPYIEMWSRRDPVSLFGAWGPCKTGWTQLAETFRWVGSRFSEGENAGVDLDVVYVSGDLAYTVGYEHAEVSIGGGGKRTIKIRATHIYRREDGEWKIVHRHGDFAPGVESAAT